MWKLIITKTQYIEDYYNDKLYVEILPWKEIIVPIERLVDTYNLFHDLYGRRVIQIQQINNE